MYVTISPILDCICLCLDHDRAVREDGGNSLVRDRVRALEGVAPQKDRARPANPAKPRGSSNRRVRAPEYLLLLLIDPGLEAHRASPLEIFEYKRRSARPVYSRNSLRIVI